MSTCFKELLWLSFHFCTSNIASNVSVKFQLAYHQVFWLVLQTAYILTESLVNKFTDDSFTFWIEFVALPARLFRTELWILAYVIRLHSAFGELGHFDYCPVWFFVINVREEVVLACGWLRGCCLALEPHRLALGIFCWFSRSSFSTERVECLKERIVWFTFIKLSFKQAATRFLWSIRLRLFITSFQCRFLWNTSWNATLVTWLWKFWEVCLLMRSNRGVNIVLLLTISPLSSTLSWLGDCHSFLLPYHLDSL